MSVAVYPGSFDPITNGHLDIVERAAAVFDTVVVAVLANPRKAPLFSVDQRIEVIRAALAAHRVPDDRVDVDSFDGLTVKFARARGASAIVRGLRAISDFETELQLAHITPAMRDLIPMAEESLAAAERAVDALWVEEAAVV